MFRKKKKGNKKLIAIHSIGVSHWLISNTVSFLNTFSGELDTYWNSYAAAFKMRPRISIIGCVLWSVGWSVGWSVTLELKISKRGKNNWK